MKENNNELGFEESLTRLEKIVTILEEGTVSLDESIKLYEEGIILSNKCVKVLNDAKQKIEIIKNEHYEKNDIEADVIAENL